MKEEIANNYNFPLKNLTEKDCLFSKSVLFTDKEFINQIGFLGLDQIKSLLDIKT